MSDMKFVKGKLKPTGLNINDFLDSKNINYQDVDDAKNELYYNFNKTHVVVNSNVYEKIEYEELDPCGYSCVKEQEDGTIDFIAIYYNGGTCLTEVIEDSINE